MLICNDSETILEAALAGEGLLITPLWGIKNRLASGQLVEVPVDVGVSCAPTSSVDLYILYQQGKYQIPKIKYCVDFIIEHLGLEIQEA